MKTELFESGVKEIKRSFRFIHIEFVVQWNYIENYKNGTDVRTEPIQNANSHRKKTHLQCL